MTCKSYNTGSSLIETLVTVIVLAVGLLGIATLQLQSKRTHYEAMQRSTASMLTNEIIERMRNNASQLSDYLTSVGGGSITAEPTPDCSDASRCSPQQLAQHDLWEWEQMLDGASEQLTGVSTGGLQRPTACITGPAGGGAGLYNASIVWRGQTAMESLHTDPCGTASGKYDLNPGDNTYRQILTLQVYIDASS